MAKTTSLPTGDDQDALPAGDTPGALPEGYEVLLADGQGEAQVQEAEQFGEELIALRNIVQRYADQLDKLREEIAVQSESLGNLYDNDEELQNLEEQAKTMTQDVTTKRQRLKETPEAVQIQMKVRELKEEKNEIQETLNNHLLRYYQMTGSQVIEDEAGQERHISIRASLSRKKVAA